LRSVFGPREGRNAQLDDGGRAVGGVGIAGLIVQNVQFTESKEVLDIGPLELRSEEQHNIPIPTIAGVLAIVAGLGMIFASRRSA
jgi:hypothetical protein